LFKKGSKLRTKKGARGVKEGKTNSKTDSITKRLGIRSDKKLNQNLIVHRGRCRGNSKGIRGKPGKKKGGNENIKSLQ